MARILLIDDSKIMCLTLKALLENRGHKIVGEAGDGLAGYDKYFELKPDIVITDLTMPILNGIATIKKIREEDSNAKIILLTSNTNDEKLSEAVKAGVAEILFKPVDENQLMKAVDHIINKEGETG